MITPKIIFYGSADFAVESLQLMVDSGYRPIAVVTAPDRKAGRGQKVISTPVKEAAQRLEIPILQPTNLRSDDFFAQVKELNPNLQVIVAFRMMPERIWNFPSLGSINLHASLLPQYRGAAPIHWAIINGEKTTGVSTFFLKHEIDTGDIIMQEGIPILEEDTLGALYEKLKVQGAGILLKTIKAISEGKVKEKAQGDASNLQKAPKISSEDAKILWEKTSEQVYNLVRGMNPFPGAWTMIDGKRVKIHRVKKSKENAGPPGNLTSDGKTFVRVGCGKGSVFLEELQAEGKRKMTIEEFLKGNKI